MLRQSNLVFEWTFEFRIQAGVH